MVTGCYHDRRPASWAIPSSPPAPTHEKQAAKLQPTAHNALCVRLYMAFKWYVRCPAASGRVRYGYGSPTPSGRPLLSAGSHRWLGTRCNASGPGHLLVSVIWQRLQLGPEWGLITVLEAAAAAVADACGGGEPYNISGGRCFMTNRKNRSRHINSPPSLFPPFPFPFPKSPAPTSGQVGHQGGGGLKAGELMVTGGASRQSIALALLPQFINQSTHAGH